jgi:hypothetical protein
MKTGKLWEVVTPITTGNPNKSYWQRLGRAWEHVSDSGDGKVFIRIKLNALPINGDLMLFLKEDAVSTYPPPGPPKTQTQNNQPPDDDMPPHRDEDAPGFGSDPIYEE